MKKIVIILVIIICLGWFIVCVKSCRDQAQEDQKKQEEKAIKYGEEMFQYQLDAVRRGEQDYLYFNEYSIHKSVDKKLHELEGMQDVALIFLRWTDFSDQGMKSINSFPRLKKLGIMGSSLSDKGLEYLKNNPSLEVVYLVLRDSQITEKGLEIFQTIPHLKTLVLYQHRDTTHPQTLSIKSMGKLKQISDLRIGGMGFSKQELEELQHVLPHTKFLWLTDWPDWGDVLGKQFYQ
jgi:hypothetical protein